VMVVLLQFFGERRGLMHAWIFYSAKAVVSIFYEEP